MKVGAEPKKVAILGGLLLVGGYFFYSNVISDPNEGQPHPQPGPAAQKNRAVNAVFDTGLGAAPSAPKGPVVRSTSRTKTSEEFRPSLKRKPEDVVDLPSIDPTLRWDLLAKVQGQQVETAGRNPFQFGQPPAPPIPPTPKVIPKTKEQIAAEQKKPEAPKVDPGPPPKPPLNLSWKYYGYTSPRGSPQKRAFFLDGEEIITANEGEVLRKKYKVVRIGVNSVVMEDVDTKSQQTLPLAEEALG